MDSCLLQKAMTWAWKLISVIDWGTRFPALLFLDRKIRWISLLLDPTSARLQLAIVSPQLSLCKSRSRCLNRHQQRWQSLYGFLPRLEHRREWLCFSFSDSTCSVASLSCSWVAPWDKVTIGKRSYLQCNSVQNCYTLKERTFWGQNLIELQWYNYILQSFHHKLVLYEHTFIVF